MKIPRIENWSLVGGELRQYDPPELTRFSIAGQVFGNPKFDEGKRITTSAIVAISGCEVETHSGSIYQLGKPSDDYMLWCQENGYHIPTPDEPIKLL